jgi:hypothetical protein
VCVKVSVSIRRQGDFSPHSCWHRGDCRNGQREQRRSVLLHCSVAQCAPGTRSRPISDWSLNLWLLEKFECPQTEETQSILRAHRPSADTEPRNLIQFRLFEDIYARPVRPILSLEIKEINEIRACRDSAGNQGHDCPHRPKCH